MVRKLMLSAAAAAFAMLPVAAVAGDEGEAPQIERKIPEGPPSAMTNAEIAEHNEGLDLRHPDFIKCRKLDVIGSLVKKARVCRTNEQWTASWQKGNQNVRDTAEAYAPKFIDCRNPGAC